MSTTIGAGDLDALQQRVTGSVAEPGSAGYNEAVAIWNGAIDRHPAVVVRCASSADVASTLSFAQDRGLEVSVRGGGHGFSGFAVTDGGVMIDLTPLKSVHVDPEAKMAVAGGGVTWAELDAAGQRHGLAVPGGLVSHTGIAGLTLGGGIGWLSGLAGLSCDNLAAAELVTADGQVLRASEDQHPDLFWALRGGGGNFGVVTSFEYRIHDVGPLVNRARAPRGLTRRRQRTWSRLPIERPHGPLPLENQNPASTGRQGSDVLTLVRSSHLAVTCGD